MRVNSIGQTSPGHPGKYPYLLAKVVPNHCPGRVPNLAGTKNPVPLVNQIGQSGGTVKAGKEKD